MSAAVDGYLEEDFPVPRPAPGSEQQAQCLSCDQEASDVGSLDQGSADEPSDESAALEYRQHLKQTRSPYEEAGRLVRMALPLSAASLCSFAVGLVTTGFVGRLGQQELSVSVLGTSIFNVTGLSIVQGFVAAMETFCGGAYGAGNYAAIGVTLQRVLAMSVLLCALVGALWTQVGRLLVLLRQDAAIAAAAARYVQLMLPALWCLAISESCRRYLVCQGEVRIPTVSSVAALAAAPLYNWAFINALSLGLDGAAMAVNAVQATAALIMVVYIVAREARLQGTARSTWPGWRPHAALRGWPVYLRYALPSVAMLCTEWWTFEILIIFSGWLDDPEMSISAMGLLVSMSGVVFSLMAGLSLACSARVSSLLGAGTPAGARRAGLVALGLGVACEAVVAVALLCLSHQWPRLFTTVPAVIAATARLTPLLAASLIGDGANAVMQGLLRGAGKQRLGAAANICSYWIFAIPLAAFLAFRCHLGLAGLWWGLVAVNTLQGSVMAVIALRLDYALLASRAATLAHRVRSRSLSLDAAWRPLLASPRCADCAPGGGGRLAAEGGSGGPLGGLE